MQMIDAQRVHELLEYNGLVEAIREAHLGEMPKDLCVVVTPEMILGMAEDWLKGWGTI